MDDEEARLGLGGVVSGVPWVVRHVVGRVQQRRRRRDWATRTQPFEFRTSEGLCFVLHPHQLIDGEIFAEGAYELRFLDLIRAIFVGDGLVALDVGANIGNHALHLSDVFAEIHCFEPNPKALARLRTNLHLSNREQRVRVHAVGLSDRDDELAFAVDEGNLGGSHFAPDDASPNSIVLPVRRGDTYLEDHDISRVDFLKLDVENHELEVLRGLRQTIARHRPLIAFEYHGGVEGVPPFDELAETMPDYTFAEACHAPHDASPRDKLVWNLQHRGRPVLRVFEHPEARTYENVIAFPDGATFDAALRSASSR